MILHSNLTNASFSLKVPIPTSFLLKCKMLNLVQIWGKFDKQMKPLPLVRCRSHFNSWKMQLTQAWRNQSPPARVKVQLLSFIRLYKDTKYYQLIVEAGVHINTSYTRIHHIFNCRWFLWGQVTWCDTNAAHYCKLGYTRTHVPVHAEQEWIKLK